MNKRGIALLIGARLNSDRARSDDRIALGGQGETQIGFVDAHEGLARLDLLADVHEPSDDLAGNAKAEIALHPGRNDTCEAAFGVGRPRGRHQPDKRRFLPRIGYGGGLLRPHRDNGEYGNRQRREQGSPKHQNRSFFRGHDLKPIRLHSTSIHDIDLNAI